VQLAKTLSAYIARQFLAWFAGVFAAMATVTFLLDYIELCGAARPGHRPAGESCSKWPC